MVIQITTSTFGKAGLKPITYLKEKELDFRLNPFGRKLTEKEAIEIISDAEGVIAGTEPLTDKVIRSLPNLKVISRCGTGLNNVDLKAAEELGIKVFNTPEIHVDAVAELALTGALCALRRITDGDRNIRSISWKKSMGYSLYNKRVGIIGFGKVGKRFASLSSVFTDNIVFYDPYIKNDKDHVSQTAVKNVSFHELISTSDVISLHVPFTEENRNLISESEFSLCKSNVVILNTSRGGLINEKDLFHFLNNNKDAAAFLDVFEEEPYHGNLTELQNIVLTPHIGTTTKETREEMELQACINLMEGLQEYEK